MRATQVREMVGEKRGASGVKTGKGGGKTLPREDFFKEVLIEIILLAEMENAIQSFM